MGFLSKLFEKKVCAICGGEIGLFGNRKLEDGNMCKNCAAKLSEWFSDRRSSTVEEIKEQLAYREENRKAVENFRTTRVLGDDTKVMLDEDAGKFMVTDASARNLMEANPDVLTFAQVTGCEMDVEEDSDEEKREDKDGNWVSYAPPRYRHSYDFYMTIRVNHPWFDEMHFKLNRSSVETTGGTAVSAAHKPNPKLNQDYMEYQRMGDEIKNILTNAREQAREEAKAAAAPKMKVVCPWCGATTMPDDTGCCEYCGGAMKG